ncbi:MAG: hypothetical protein ABII74_07555 [Elusimicrobiota bacterium]
MKKNSKILTSAGLFIVFGLVLPVLGANSFWENRYSAGRKSQGLADSQKNGNNNKNNGKVKEEAIAFNKSGAPERTTDPNRIHVDPKFASVKEIWTPLNGKSDKLIVYIQDAHCNYEAQKNSARILESLINNYGLKLVLVEGAVGNANLSYLRKSATQEKRIEVAERYLRDGKIAGEEYLDLISDYNFKIEGVENEDLYAYNLEAFFNVEKFKSKALGILNILDKLVVNLKSNIYNKEMKELDKAKNDFDSEKMKLMDFYKYLFKLAEKKKISLDGFAQFQSFSVISKLEEKIVFSQVEKERDNLISFLTRKLDKKELKELIDKSLKFKQNNIKGSEYYGYLEGLGKKSTNFDQGYPNLVLYVQYITLNDKMETMQLFKEESLVFKRIMDGLASNDDQRQLCSVAEKLVLLNNFVNLQLSPEEYKFFNEHSLDFFPSKWQNFLVRSAKKYGFSENLPYDYTPIERNFKTLGSFYQVAEKRDDAFVNNIERNMTGSKQSFAALITGGFHADRIVDRLKEKNYSYIIFAPKFGLDDEDIYLSVLKEKGGAWLEKWREKKNRTKK